MRRKIHRSPRTSSPVLRRVFRPLVSRLEDRTLLAAMDWTGGAGDNSWGDAYNWVNAVDPSDNHVPTALDDAVINAGATVFTNGAEPIYNLTVSGASLFLGGTLTVNGLLSLTGTGQAPATVTFGTIDALGGMFLASPVQLYAATLNNYGAANWYFGEYGLDLTNAAAVNNEPGGSIVAEATAPSSPGLYAGDASQVTVNNDGTFGTAGYSFPIDVPFFTNTGTLVIGSLGLSVNSGGGTFTLGPGSTIVGSEFLDTYGTLELDGASSITGTILDNFGNAYWDLNGGDVTLSAGARSTTRLGRTSAPWAWMWPTPTCCQAPGRAAYLTTTGRSPARRCPEGWSPWMFLSTTAVSSTFRLEPLGYTFPLA